MQVTFLTYAFGGPALYSGRSMAAAHERLIAEKGLNQQHFDLVAGHLVDALTAANVSQVGSLSCYTSIMQGRHYHYDVHCSRKVMNMQMTAQCAEMSYCLLGH